MTAKLEASVKSVLQLVADNGLDGSAQIQCSIKGHRVAAKATLKLGTHSHPQSYHTYIKHLEVEFDDEYIDELVKQRVASIFAKLATDACKP